MKAKNVKPIKPSMDYLTGKHDGYEQGKKEAFLLRQKALGNDTRDRIYWKWLHENNEFVLHKLGNWIDKEFGG